MRPIDADALIEELNEKLKRCGDSEQWDEVMEQIELVKNQPTIDSESKWISVKDGLPEMHMTYHYDIETMSEIPSGIHRSDMVLIAMLHNENGFPEYCVDYGWLEDGEWCFEGYDHDICKVPSNVTVTHWMPFPDPPKVDEVIDNAKV